MIAIKHGTVVWRRQTGRCNGSTALATWPVVSTMRFERQHGARIQRSIVTTTMVNNQAERTIISCIAKQARSDVDVDVDATSDARLQPRLKRWTFREHQGKLVAVQANGRQLPKACVHTGA